MRPLNPRYFDTCLPLEEGWIAAYPLELRDDANILSCIKMIYIAKGEPYLFEAEARRRHLIW